MHPKIVILSGLTLVQQPGLPLFTIRRFLQKLNEHTHKLSKDNNEQFKGTGGPYFVAILEHNIYLLTCAFLGRKARM